MPKSSNGAIVSIINQNDKPVMLIQKKITDLNEIKILSHLILTQNEIEIPISVYNKLLFYSKLKQYKLI